MNVFVASCSIKERPYDEPAECFEEHASGYYSCLLSGKGPADISRHSYIGINPHAVVRYSGGIFEIEEEGGIEKSDREFWPFLKSLHESANFHELPYPANLCGFIGYLSYEGFHTIEKIASKTKDSYTMPVLEAAVYNRYIIHDHAEKKSYSVEMNYRNPGSLSFRETAESPGIEISNLRAECSREEYIEKVKKIINFILEGDVYEVCLTQQFEADFRGSPYILFKKIFGKNPAPFSAFMKCRDITVLCNSPELFLRCSGRMVETRPIKGTAPRGATDEEDLLNRERLLSSDKDQAELYMIIDLLRNDIGKVCKTGSVRVANKKKIEAYENVYQLIGIVEGELDKGNDYIDLMKAAFPGGSITGCPKIRSMEIIEELESYKRNLYTGSIFLFNKNHLVSNIVIRTAVIQKDRIFFNSGGAVTIDSDPEEEYHEILHKVNNIMKGMGFTEIK